MQSPTHWCLKECPAHIKIQSSARLSLLTFTCSVVCLLPQAYSNKLRLAALEAPVFHTLWCLAAQRKGMVIKMKKRILALTAIFIFIVCLSSGLTANATVSMDTNITYFEDGSYVVDLIEASPILVRGSVYTRTGSKTRTFYDSDNVVKWKFIVYGTFEVNSGVSAKCTKATCNTEIYDSNWKVISQSAWPSGNQAIGTATLKRYLLGIPVRTEEVTVTLTCDKNGTLS